MSDKIKKIVEILREYEYDLSDGYKYYLFEDDDKKIDSALAAGIAKEILAAIEQDKG